jgi:hypothetical protein
MPQWINILTPLVSLIIGYLLSQLGQYLQEERKFKRDFKLELWKKKVEDIKEIKRLTMEYAEIIFSSNNLFILSPAVPEVADFLDEGLKEDLEKLFSKTMATNFGKAALLSTLVNEYPEIKARFSELHDHMFEALTKSLKATSLKQSKFLFQNAKNSVNELIKACDEELKKFPEFKS